MDKPPAFGVILPAAGTGTRFGGGDKLLTDLHGKSVLQRSVSLFASRDDVTTILIVTSPDRFETYQDHLFGDPEFTHPDSALAARLAFTPGGRERWESVLFGLRHLATLKADLPDLQFVAIHDAARPLCPLSVIEDAFQAAIKHGASLPCIPEPATLKRRNPDGTVSETVDRRGLFQAQTPQCFRLKDLLAGYEQLLTANRVTDLTDDAQVFERIHRPVAITTGTASNVKITTAADIELARALLQAPHREPPTPSRV